MRLAVFSGTADGRDLCSRMAQAGMKTRVCVATEYAKHTMADLQGADVRVGRMDRSEMVEFLKDFDVAVDATHPYATQVTENIKNACDVTGCSYIRLFRPECSLPYGSVRVSSIDEAVDFLNTNNARALITTGSRDIEKYTAVNDYAYRLYPRILPDPPVLEKCLNLGFRRENILCMQGPFTDFLNQAMLMQIGAEYLVTKNSGDIGGMKEKSRAVEGSGARLIVIDRPGMETGYSIDEIVKLLLCKRAEVN